LQGDFSNAIEHLAQCLAIKYYRQHLAIVKEVGDRAGKGKAHANLGNACQSQGDLSKAINYHTQCLAIAIEVSDRAGEGKAHANLGNAYRSQWRTGAYLSQAIEHHSQYLAIGKGVGDRVEEGRNLGTCHMHLNVKAVAYFEAQHALSISLKLAHVYPTQRSTWVSFHPGIVRGYYISPPPPFTSGQLAMALLLALTVTRWHRCA
jgi:tetratricopeptide (TPR) repeat protein